MAGPDPRLPSPYPWLAWPLRRMMLRVIRNHWIRRGQVDRALLETIRSVRSRAENELRVFADQVVR